MSYGMGIGSCKCGKVYCNHFANPNNLCDTDSSQSFTINPGECIELTMQQPMFGEHMLYAAAMKFTNAEERIDTEVQSYSWWYGNDVIH
jgi:hypothetical protein